MLYKFRCKRKMKRYLYAQCDGLRERRAMYDWISKKGLIYVYNTMIELFGQDEESSVSKQAKETRYEIIEEGKIRPSRKANSRKQLQYVEIIPAA